MSTPLFDDAATATDSLRLHAFASLNPGPRLLVIGGVHGDETCGTEGIARVLAEFDAGDLRLLRGELTLVPVANPLARRRLQREGQRNLNRLFRPSETPADYEARITNRLAPVIARHDVLLDLHSFQSEGEAFAMIGPRDNSGSLEPFARAQEEGRLALHIGTPIVVEGWLDIYAAGLAQRGAAVDEAAIDFGRGTNEYIRSCGGYGVTLECGQHQDPQAPQVAWAAIRRTLALLGMAALPPGLSAAPPAAAPAAAPGQRDRPPARGRQLRARLGHLRPRAARRARGHAARRHAGQRARRRLHRVPERDGAAGRRVVLLRAAQRTRARPDRLRLAPVGALLPVTPTFSHRRGGAATTARAPGPT
ncbi:hypothetical protein GmRootV512_14030 [Variovorax sp. V512]